MGLRLNKPAAMRSPTIRYRIAAIVICCAACGKEHGMKGEASSGPTSAKLVSAANAANAANGRRRRQRGHTAPGAIRPLRRGPLPFCPRAGTILFTVPPHAPAR